MEIPASDLGDLVAAVREWAQLRARAETLEEAEDLAQEVSRAVGQAVVEELVGRLDERQSYAGSSVACPCGRRARFMGYRSRMVATLCGEVRVSRSYYHCRHCHRGQVSWDAAQGLNERLWSAGVKALVAEVAARVPYQETTTLLDRVLGLRLEESSAEVIVAEVGDRVRAAEASAMGLIESGESLPSEAPAPLRLYVAMDGSHAHVDGAWHEVKTGVVYAGIPGAQGRDTSGPKRYVSAQESADRFGVRLYAMASSCGVGEAREVVVIGDWAEWIWHLADHHYPEATHIVDYWHACQHIHAVAKSHYGDTSPAAARWAREHCGRLKNEGPGPLLRALGRWRPKSSDDAEAIRATRRYFSHNAARMDYPALLSRGLMIGSGPAEAACKVVVESRLKGAGMRWRSAGADAILALRCLVLNRQYDQIAQCARAA